jgi:photosystem II stability/assembly factor-like uncharacterized protein
LGFIDSQTGWATAPYGILKTINGGVNWTLQYVPQGILTHICAVDANTCFAEYITFTGVTTVNTTIARTTNGGANWQIAYSTTDGIGDNPEAFWFVNSTIGYMIKGKLINKSMDGGTTWTEEVKIQSAPCYFTDIFFTDANHGWASSSHGQILRYSR